jgi:HTH-type transcriptional repressor of puuD
MYLVELSYHLKHYREKNNLLQKQMADKFGWTREYYARVENGKILPSVKSINEIAELIGVRIHLLFPLSDPEILPLFQKHWEKFLREANQQKKNAKNNQGFPPPPRANAKTNNTKNVPSRKNP